jgi:hypothetical protein
MGIFGSPLLVFGLPGLMIVNGTQFGGAVLIAAVAADGSHL